MANVMGYLYFRINLFISWHFHDWRHVVLAVQDRTAGQIRAQHQLEVACRCRQPVGLVPGGSRALQINVDGAIGVRHEVGARADAGAIDGVTHHVPDHIGHGQRPEGIVGRELSFRKMQDVLALAGEPPPRAVDGRRPVRSLLHHIDGGQHFGAGGPQEDAIAGLAAFEGGAPTVDSRGHGFNHRVHNDLCREKRQHAADDDSLHDVRD